MATDTGKTLMILGVAGAGGYLLYEHSQYSNGVNVVAAAGNHPAAAVQQALPFTTYLQMVWGMTPASDLFKAIQAGAGGTLQAPSGQTPGTTDTMQRGGGTTSVSTAPPSTSTPAPSGTMTTLANNMAAAIGLTSGTADQWNVAFTRVMGQGIDSKFNLNFDQVYGPVVNGVRNNGATMSALMFLQLAASAAGGTLPGLSGFGRIARFPGNRLITPGTMLYQAHHPFPYTPTWNLSGMGAYTQTTGGERALWAGTRRRRLT